MLRQFARSRYAIASRVRYSATPRLRYLGATRSEQSLVLLERFSAFAASFDFAQDDTSVRNPDALRPSTSLRVTFDDFLSEVGNMARSIDDVAVPAA